MEDWRSRSERATLKPLEMAILGGALADGQLVLDVQFVNRSESFVLAGDLGGEDFLLWEVGGAIHPPSTFSDSLRVLDDGGGIAPGDKVFGTVTFPAPETEQFELHFTDFEPIGMTRAAFGVRPVSQSLGAGPGAAGESVSRNEADEVEGFGVSAPGRGMVDDGQLADRAEDGEVAALDGLLDRQARALERYDLEGYLETFAPSAHERERTIFHRIRELPLVAVELERLTAPGSGGVEVEMRYRLDGLGEDNPFVHTLRFGFEQDAEGVRITRIDEAPIDAAGGRPVPWRAGDLVLHRSHHFLLVTHPSLRGDLVDLASDAEAAYASLLSQGFPLDTGYAVHLVADLQLYTAVAGRPRSLGVAVARYATDGAGTTRVDSRAFYINGTVFSNRGRNREVARVRHLTVTHELVHLALAADTRPTTPIWLKEGVAVLFSGDLDYDRTSELVARGLERLDLERMTRAATLGEHDAVGQQTADEYLYAGQVARYLLEQGGQESLLDFYRAFARVSPAELARLVLSNQEVQRQALAGLTTSPSSSEASRLEATLTEALTRELLQTHFGFDVGELDAEVRDWLRLRHPT